METRDWAGDPDPGLSSLSLRCLRARKEDPTIDLQILHLLNRCDLVTRRQTPKAFCMSVSVMEERVAVWSLTHLGTGGSLLRTRPPSSPAHPEGELSKTI